MNKRPKQPYIDRSEKELLRRPISESLSTPSKSNIRLSSAIERTKCLLLKNGVSSLSPQFYFSDDWFCLEGSRDVAIPFYLADERLLTVARKFKISTDVRYSLHKYLLHECGHAFFHAYNVGKDSTFIKLFGKADRYNVGGKFSSAYDKTHYVNVLHPGYARCHPEEDFAETFAYVMLNSQIAPAGKRSVIEKKMDFIRELILRFGSKKIPKSKKRFRAMDLRRAKIRTDELLERMSRI